MDRWYREVDLRVNVVGETGGWRGVSKLFG